MLIRLHIENVAVIERADIELGGGLIALTGETGAGKSIIIDSLNMLLGNRTSRDIVRSGCRKAVVNASFSVGAEPEFIHVCSEFGIEPEDGLLLLQREVSADGKSVSRVNGRQVTASALREIGKFLVSIHGQQDSASLLDPSTHIRYLDRYAADSEILEKYKQIFHRAVSLRRRIRSMSADDGQKARRAELLKYQIDEITAAALEEGEEAVLEERRRVLLNAEKITENLAAARQLLHTDSGSASETVSAAARQLQNISGLSSRVSSLCGRLAEVRDVVDDISDDIRQFLEDCDFSRAELEQTEERLELISGLKRKYGAGAEQINAYAESARKELESIETSESVIAQLESEFEECSEELARSAEELTAVRTAAAKRLEKAVVEELSFLNMPDVRFKVSMSTSDAKPYGCDTVEFLLSANVGEQLKPLSRIASGGELSRIMLSIKNVLADADIIETSVFDEIDAGVSGKAAQKIAMKLKQISAGRQVIAVTHLAHIAAYADHHLLIEKYSDGQKTYTSVKELDMPGRISELSRILGGMDITDSVTAAAAEMLSNAQGS